MKKRTIILSVLISAISLITVAQNSNIQPGYVGKKISDFKLQTYQGTELAISDLEGKNVLLVFPRGKVMENIWCGLCMYQYAELAYLEQHEKIRKTYDLEIVYVLMLDQDSTEQWYKGFPERLARIEQWKYPADTTNQAVMDWAYFCREAFPQKFEYTEKTIPRDFPVMMDVDKKVSKAFGLYRYQWDGTMTDQNIPTIFLLDKDGVIRFKYHSQATQDRPSADYLIEMMDKLL
ncbi:MAG: TlpA family protein disulfide reductase [Bacteroidales bacterium]|nr:TlpA family protein disulfide reductase [Bacteroidales bacterium]